MGNRVSHGCWTLKKSELEVRMAVEDTEPKVVVKVVKILRVQLRVHRLRTRRQGL